MLTRSMQYSCHFTKDKCKSNESRGEKILKELLCHPNHGLAIYIAFNKFIVLKSSETDLEHFIEDCLNLKLQDTADLCVDINNEIVCDIIDSMDTAWDKKVMKVVLGVYIL